MADLLGSILGAMDKPPSISEQQRKKAKAEEEKLNKLRKQERVAKEKFRKSIEDAIEQFAKDHSKTREKLLPMNKLERTIVHEMADEAGLTSQAFGREEQDRHIMLFKKEFPPVEDEIEAYKRGETWDKQKAEDCQKQKEFALQERLSDESRDPPSDVVPASNYKDKYNHLIGTSAAKDAAKRTEANKSFGMVPSLNKRDQRSIEETMNEIRAKKRIKTSEDPSQVS